MAGTGVQLPPNLIKLDKSTVVEEALNKVVDAVARKALDDMMDVAVAELLAKVTPRIEQMSRKMAADQQLLRKLSQYAVDRIFEVITTKPEYHEYLIGDVGKIVDEAHAKVHGDIVNALAERMRAVLR